MKIALPDLISNSYFPAVAAVDLGCFAAEGIDASIELIFPVDAAYRALRDGAVDLVAGSAHSAVAAFPEWRGVKLLAAQGQGMYWFLVMRADLAGARGDLSVVKGRRIGAAPWVELGLRAMLDAAGIDPARDDVTIAPAPGAKPEPGQVVNFGVTAARALADGKIDGFWANGMGAEVAVREGAGRIVADVRRGDGPEGVFDYTMASIAGTDALVAETPDRAAATVRALRRAQILLAQDPDLATSVAARRFPAREAGYIADLVRRDAPFYRAEISPAFVDGMTAFSRRVGILVGNPSYTDVVATSLSPLWTWEPNHGRQ